MAGDLEALLKVSASVSALMSYARFASAKTPPGHLRLLALLPSILPLFFLPLSFSSIHLRGISGFFLAWLAVFKLLLLSFAAGPLSPSLLLHIFIPVAALPVKIRPPISSPIKPPHFFPTAIKALLLSILINLYSYRHRFPHHLLLAIYSIHIYLSLELVLAGSAFIAGGIMNGFDLEPQFDAPFLSTSLQDFWGRRWNLMVTGILRPSVYDPVRRRWGKAAGVMATFLVSGVMHELMFYYMTLAPPTGEVSCFFVLHGACTAVEGWVKRVAGEDGMRVNPAVSTVMTLGFVAGTGFWLFFPPVVRNGSDEVVVEECAAAMRVFKESGRMILDRIL